MDRKRLSLIFQHVSPAAGAPLYRQITDALKRAISEGLLSPAEGLPSFRELAEMLLVSLITVKRAYEDLEREGIIYRRQGLGTFVAERGQEQSRRARREESRRLLAQALREAVGAGLEPGEIMSMIREVMGEEMPRESRASTPKEVIHHESRRGKRN